MHYKQQKVSDKKLIYISSIMDIIQSNMLYQKMIDINVDLESRQKRHLQK